MVIVSNPKEVVGFGADPVRACPRMSGDQTIETGPITAERNRLLARRAPKTEMVRVCRVLMERVISYLLGRLRDHPAAMSGVLHPPCQVQKMAEIRHFCCPCP